MNDKQKAFEEIAPQWNVEGNESAENKKNWFYIGWNARDAEVAELKKQLAEQQEFFDGLGDVFGPEENNIPSVQAVSVPDDPAGFPHGFAAFYNRAFSGRAADTGHLADCEEVWRAAMLAKQGPISAAIRDVIAERQRQITAEGWTPEHDDKHGENDLLMAAVCYLQHAIGRGWIFDSDPDDYKNENCPNDWPWDSTWWKPKNPRRDIVRALALGIAALERLDRANGDKGAR